MLVFEWEVNKNCKELILDSNNSTGQSPCHGAVAHVLGVWSEPSLIKRDNVRAISKIVDKYVQVEPHWELKSSVNDGQLQVTRPCHIA